MKIKWIDIYLAIITIILAGFIVASRSSMALTSSTFVFSAKCFKYLLMIVPFVGGWLIPIGLEEALLYIFLFTMAAVTWYQSKDATIFQAMCMIFGFRKIDFKKIVEVFIFGLGLGTITILLGLFFGKFTSLATVSGSDNLVKTSLGFILPNTAGLTLFVLILAIYYAFYNKYRHQLILFFCTLPLAYLVYRTGARTSFLLVIILYLFWGLLLNGKVVEYVLHHMVKIIMGAALIIIVFSYVTSMSYASTSSVWLRHLNDITTNRIALGSQAINNYGLTFLGQFIPYNTISSDELWWNKSSYFWIDNAYIKLLVNDGVFWMGVLLYGLYVAVKKAKAAGDAIFVVPIILMLVLGYSESALLYNWFDFMLFSAVAVFSRRESRLD